MKILQSRNVSFVMTWSVVVSLGLASVARAAETPASQSAAPSASASEEIEKLNDRITELEVQNRLNRVQFSGTFITHYENLVNHHGLPGASRETDHVAPFGMYFGLNMDWDITKNFKFYSTLAMSKFFNNEDRAESLTKEYYATYQATEIGGWAYNGSIPKFDRAFVSYDFDTIPLTLAVGRMPTNNGPPANQSYGQPRSGTYPRYVFNAIFDGLAAAYDFSSLLPETNSVKVRAFYQPFTFIDRGSRTLQYVDGEKLPSSANQGAILAEYSKSGLSFMDRIDVMLMHSQWSQFYIGHVGPPAPLGKPMVGEYEDGTDEALYLGFENIGKIGLGISYTALLYRAVDSSLPDLHKQSLGHFLTISQKIPFLGNSIVGYEFYRTQPYHYLDEWTRLNLMPFAYLQNAIGHRAYLTVPLVNKIYAQVGYYNIQAGAGDVYQLEESDAQSWYAELRFTF